MMYRMGLLRRGMSGTNKKEPNEAQHIVKFLVRALKDDPKASELAKKFNSWEHLFTSKTLALKQLGFTPQQRKLILKACEEYDCLRVSCKFRHRQKSLVMAAMEEYALKQKREQIEQNILAAEVAKKL